MLKLSQRKVFLSRFLVVALCIGMILGFCPVAVLAHNEEDVDENGFLCYEGNEEMRYQRGGYAFDTHTMVKMDLKNMTVELEFRRDNIRTYGDTPNQEIVDALSANTYGRCHGIIDDVDNTGLGIHYWHFKEMEWDTEEYIWDYAAGPDCNQPRRIDLNNETRFKNEAPIVLYNMEDYGYTKIDVYLVDWDEKGPIAYPKGIISNLEIVPYSPVPIGPNYLENPPAEEGEGEDDQGPYVIIKGIKVRTIGGKALEDGDGNIDIIPDPGKEVGSVKKDGEPIPPEDCPPREGGGFKIVCGGWGIMPKEIEVIFVDKEPDLPIGDTPRAEGGESEIIDAGPTVDGDLKDDKNAKVLKLGCICRTKCTEDDVNERCPVCDVDIKWCKGLHPAVIAAIIGGAAVAGGGISALLMLLRRMRRLRKRVSRMFR